MMCDDIFFVTRSFVTHKAILHGAKSHTTDLVDDTLENVHSIFVHVCLTEVDHVLVVNHGVLVAHHAIALGIYRLVNATHASEVLRAANKILTAEFTELLLSKDRSEGVVNLFTGSKLPNKSIHVVGSWIVFHLALEVGKFAIFLSDLALINFIKKLAKLLMGQILLELELGVGYMGLRSHTREHFCVGNF